MQRHGSPRRSSESSAVRKIMPASSKEPAAATKSSPPDPAEKIPISPPNVLAPRTTRLAVSRGTGRPRRRLLGSAQPPQRQRPRADSIPRALRQTLAAPKQSQKNKEKFPSMIEVFA